MASKVEIFNFALQEIGEASVTSPSEDTPGAIECNLRYDSARRQLLNMHQWNFATKRATLARETGTPDSTYPYQYTLPSDFLYLIMNSTEESYQAPPARIFTSSEYLPEFPQYGGIEKYRLEQRKMLSYNSTEKIVYVADITDTSLFDGVFTELLSRLLAAKIAYRLTGNKADRIEQLQLFKQEFDMATSIDSQQGVFDRIEVSRFLSEMQ